MDKDQIKDILENIKDKKQGQALRECIDMEIESLKEEATEKVETMEEVYGCRKAIERLKSFKRKLQPNRGKVKKPDYS